jgi:hypothetical protein
VSLDHFDLERTAGRICVYGMIFAAAIVVAAIGMWLA